MSERFRRTAVETLHALRDIEKAPVTPWKISTSIGALMNPFKGKVLKTGKKKNISKEDLQMAIKWQLGR